MWLLQKTPPQRWTEAGFSEVYQRWLWVGDTLPAEPQPSVLRNWCEELGGCSIHLPTCPPHSLCGKLLLRLLPKPADLFALVSVYGEGILVSQVLMLLETSAATRRPSLHHYYWVACSYSLIPDTHLTRRHIGRLRPLLASLRLVLSQSKPRLVLCRWLAGSIQRIHTPYF